MELTESKAYEALGVQPEPPSAEGGAKEQEPADPAAQEQDTTPTTIAGTSAEVPKPADAGAISRGDQSPLEDPPALRGGETDTHSTEEGGNEQEAAEPAEAEGAKAGKEQTPEQRKDAAAARRRAEQQAAIDEAVQKALQEEKNRSKSKMDAFFKRAKLKNTITGEPINSMEEFDAWEKAFSDAKLQRDLKAGKLTPEALEKMVSELPAVKQAQELVRKQEEAAAQARVEAELLEIQKLDPTVRSVEDLLRMPKAKEFYALVQKGNSFLDAFRLANMDQLTARTAEAAKQQAQNLTRSKDHLTPAGGARGGGAVSVPPDELRLFREMNPGASEAEIQAYYNKYKGK